MRLSAFFRPIPELLAFSLLGLMILSAANAQTSSEPDGRGAWRFLTRRGHTQSRSLGYRFNAAPPSPDTNAKVESEPGYLAGVYRRSRLCHAFRKLHCLLYE
jgi:hypothetical protein